MNQVQWLGGMRRGTVLIERNVHVGGASNVIGGFMIPGDRLTTLAGEHQVWEPGPGGAPERVVAAGGD